MFEKEAEENFMCKKVLYKWETDKRSYIDGFKDGCNKANEWHYVKDGNYPKNNTQVLVLLENKRMKISTFMENKFTVWNKDYNTYTKLYNVIAWKEIVLPKGE